MKALLLNLLLISFVLAGNPGQVQAAEISKQQAASIAKSRYPGRIIDVKQSSGKNGSVYRVKILDKSGGIHIVIINKQNGNIVSAH